MELLTKRALAVHGPHACLFAEAVTAFQNSLPEIYSEAASLKQKDIQAQHQRTMESLLERQTLTWARVTPQAQAPAPWVPPAIPQLPQGAAWPPQPPYGTMLSPPSGMQRPAAGLQSRRHVCNLWDGTRCHFKEVFPRKQRCELEGFHLAGVNTFSGACH